MKNGKELCFCREIPNSNILSTFSGDKAVFGGSFCLEIDKNTMIRSFLMTFWSKTGPAEECSPRLSDKNFDQRFSRRFQKT